MSTMSKEFRLQEYKPFTIKEIISKDGVVLSQNMILSIKIDIERDPIHTEYRKEMKCLVERNTKELATLFTLHPKFKYFQGFSFIYDTLVEILPTHEDAYEVSLYILTNHFGLSHDNELGYMDFGWKRTLAIIKVLNYKRYQEIQSSLQNQYQLPTYALFESWGLDAVNCTKNTLDKKEKLLDFIITTSSDSISFIAATIMLNDDFFIEETDSINEIDVEVFQKFRRHLDSPTLVQDSTKVYQNYSAIMKKRMEFDVMFVFGFIIILAIGLLISKRSKANKRNIPSAVEVI